MMVKEEMYVISRYGGSVITYDKVQLLPVYERRMLLHRLATDAKKQQEEHDKIKAKNTNQSSLKRKKL
jgi:hypothetical protein